MKNGFGCEQNDLGLEGDCHLQVAHTMGKYFLRGTWKGSPTSVGLSDLGGQWQGPRDDFIRLTRPGFFMDCSCDRSTIWKVLFPMTEIHGVMWGLTFLWSTFSNPFLLLWGDSISADGGCPKETPYCYHSPHSQQYAFALGH